MSLQGVTLIDLRPDESRRRQPLEPLTDLPVRAITLEAIEEGNHGLSASLGPLVVICERGGRSGLAARYLQADGLEARAYAGGFAAFQESFDILPPLKQWDSH